MFDALFKPKFYSKCKSRLKLIKTRLETIRKKRNAVQKFLKKDIAELLRSALHYNAYGRAEGLLIEQNMSSCYELVAKFATCILGRVRDLYKRSDCPDDCKEAISSLIYAAAWISDLPELRELRTLFTDKFGDSLEPYTSKEFVEKLRQDPPSKEMKIQLLHDLAQEFSIEWNSKALEQTLYMPPLIHEKKKHDELNHHNEVEWKTSNDVTVSKTDDMVTKGKQRDGRDFLKYEENERDTLSQGRKNISDVSCRLLSSTDDEITTDNSSLDGPRACSSSIGVSEDEVESKRPFSYKLVPPPYIKEKSNKGDMVTKGKQRDGRDCLKYEENERDTLSQGRKNISDASWGLLSRTDDETTTDNSSLDGPRACSSSIGGVSEDEVESKRPFSYKFVPPPYIKEKPNKGESSLKKTTASEAISKNESDHDLQKPVVPEKPIPRSVRRRPLKPPPDYNSNTASDSKTGDTAKVDSARMESEKAKQHQRTKLADEGDSRDTEEWMMDGFLMHYSKKQSPYESDMGKAYTKDHHFQPLEYDNGHTQSKSHVPLVRGTSLFTPENTSLETFKKHGRATSCAPEMLRAAGNVHPSLPDCDDLPARLAALRGR